MRFILIVFLYGWKKDRFEIAQKRRRNLGETEKQQENS